LLRFKSDKEVTEVPVDTPLPQLPSSSSSRAAEEPTDFDDEPRGRSPSEVCLFLSLDFLSKTAPEQNRFIVRLVE